MTRFDQTNPNFDQWLDGFVRGESTPNDEASNDDPESRQLRQAASQFHDLAGRADAVMDDPATIERLDHIWENVMMNTQAPAATAAIGPGGLISGGPAGRANRLFARHRWPSIVNSLVAAALILGLGFGMWQTFQGLSGGNGPEPTQFAGLVQGDPTPTVEPTEVPPTAAFEPTPTVELTGGEGGEPTVVPEESTGAPVPTLVPGEVPPVTNQDGTPIAAPVVGSIDMPGAEECTVTPLTVDQVLAAIDQPSDGQMAPDALEDYVGSGAEDISTTYTGAPPEEVFNQVSALQREWSACVLAGSWMQLFALMDPSTIERIVTERLYPTYLTIEEGRAIIETLEATGLGPHGETAGYVFGEERITLVNPDPSQSRIVGQGYVQPSILVLGLNGEVQQVLDYPGINEERTYSYGWDRQSKTWRMLDVQTFIG